MKNRLSNIELLRIVAMSMIVIWHFLIHGGAIDRQPILWCITPLFVMGVDTFIMISGYFMIRLNLKSILRLAGIIFLCFFANWIFCNFVELPISAKPLLATFLFPFSNSGYWFVAVYFALMIISPVLNKAVEHMDISEYRKLMVILTLFEFLSCALAKNTVDKDGYGLFNFLYIYILGSYLRVEPMIDKLKTSKLILCLSLTIALGVAMNFLLLFFFPFAEKTVASYPANLKFLCSYSFPTVVVSSALLLLIFSRIKVKSKIVNLIAPASFGVYMLQDGEVGYSMVYPYLSSLFHKHGYLDWGIYCATLFFIYWIISLFLTNISLCLSTRANIFLTVHMKKFVNFYKKKQIYH